MASTYTTNLRLTLPTTGELAGSWGGVVNTGVTSLVEAALSGTATVTHDDSASYTLTTANGAADEARQMFLNITGTLTVARNVVCPTSSKLYYVKNATTGGFALTLKTAAGTGISVPNGKIMALYCDGTNVVEAATYFSAPSLGTATATTLNKVTITAPASAATLTIADGATLTATATASIAGTHTGSSSGTNTGDQTNISGNAATATNVAVGGITGLGTGVATALGVAVGSAGSVVVNGGALGTPSSGSLANCTAYPGTSALVTTGALNSGSITSGFGSIDVGTDAISGGQFVGTRYIAGKASSDANNYAFQGYSTSAYTNGLQMTYGGVGAAGIWVNSSGNMEFGVDGASGTTNRMTLTSTGLAVTGALSATGVYSTTTASAANVFVDTDGSMKRSTSTAALKREVEDMDPTIAVRLVELFRAVWYRSLCPGDKPDWSWFGGIAEEVAAIDQRFVHFGYLDTDYEQITVSDADAQEPVMDTVLVDQKVIELRDGVPVLVTRQVDTQEPRTVQTPVVDEDGNPVMTEHKTTDAEGIETVEQVPMMCAVPITKTVSKSHIERKLKPGAVLVPVGLQYERFTVPLMVVAKLHEQRLAALEAA